MELTPPTVNVDLEMNQKILVVDDEEDILNLLGATLKAEGYEVVKALDAQDGIARFHVEDPDLVITDMKMPRKNGLEFLKEMKASGSDVEVIVLTGHSDEATAVDCFKNGAYDYLVKPLEDIDMLLAAVERAIDKRNLEMRNKQLIRQLAAVASKEPLTDVYNYRDLHTSLDEEITRSERYGRTFCCVMIDIDRLESTRDHYGRLFGDRVLGKLGELIGQHFRSADRLFRYAGENFFIVMPETTIDGAVTATNRVTNAINNHKFVIEGHHTPISVSMGGSFYPDHAKNKSALIKFAKHALYRAKKSGRNTIALST